MKQIVAAVGVALYLTWITLAHAATGALCIKGTLNGSLKMRATGTCKSGEIQLGSFDGTTLQFNGINVQIVSGSGTTDGPTNGKGNLIVGYNEPGVCAGVPSLCRTDTDCPPPSLTTEPGHCDLRATSATNGSHNVVVGSVHTFASYGGLVVGEQNNITAPWASVSGGEGNTASGNWASVSGGFFNSATLGGASVSGGDNNVASAVSASVSGGELNTANVDGASVSGGGCNIAGSGQPRACISTGTRMSVSGGFNNVASGGDASVSGGSANTATQAGTSVSGGTNLNSGIVFEWHAGQRAGFPTGTEY